MTEAVRAQLVEALQNTNGDKNLVAARMGWPVEKVTKVLKSDSDLRAHFVTPKDPLSTPTAATTISRQPIEQTEEPLAGPGANGMRRVDPEQTPKAIIVSEVDSLLAEKIAAEDEAVKKGLVLMGLNPKEMDEAIAIQAFHRDFFRHSLELIGGGITRNSIKLRTELTNIEGRLEKVRQVIDGLGAQQTPDREKWVLEEKGLMKAHSQASMQLTKIFQESTKGAYVMALIRTSKKTLKQAKPGFTTDV